MQFTSQSMPTFIAGRITVYLSRYGEDIQGCGDSLGTSCRGLKFALMEANRQLLRRRVIQGDVTRGTMRGSDGVTDMGDDTDILAEIRKRNRITVLIDSSGRFVIIIYVRLLFIINAYSLIYIYTIV